MPSFLIPADELVAFGIAWQQIGGNLGRSNPYSSGAFCELFDRKVGELLSTMLGGIPIVKPNRNALTPSQADCVEVGPVRVIGGVRPQNFDVGYRPDGIRFAFDSKSLNDKDSVGKNWQNMINDLATEATTVHSRFPQAVVAFMVIIPEPCIEEPRLSAIIQTLERLSKRVRPEEAAHRAEAIALAIWNPVTGEINPAIPNVQSPLRIETFSEQIQAAYVSRYKGLPPHTSE
ncbi:MAG: hypothetical protein LH609_02870 [Rudanella sp.]|nr:hypothetical protein [Rudanella sp.]